MSYRIQHFLMNIKESPKTVKSEGSARCEMGLTGKDQEKQITRDKDKTKEHLIKEIQELHLKIAELETVEIQRQRAEEALRESENRYKFLVDNSKEIILILNKRGKVIFANKYTLANYGYSEGELIGKSIARLLTRDSIKKALYALAQQFLGHPYPEIEVQAKTKSGEMRYLRVSTGSTPIYHKGKLIEVMVSASDITERRKAEEKVRESEGRFRDLWDHAPVAYHTLDSKGIITSVNQTEIKMLGYTKEEMIGKAIFEFVLPEQRAEAQARFQQKVSGHHTPKAENRIYVKKDGSEIYVMIDDVLERNSNGKVMGVRTTMADITKDKEVEAALKISEELYRDLVEKAGIAISIDDEEGNFKYVNERLAEIFGYSMEEMKKQSIRSTVHPDDLERVMGYHAGRLQGKKVPSRYEFKGLKKDGSIIYLEVCTVTLKEGENSVGTRAYLWDITERKRTEEMLRESETRFRSVVENSYEGIFIVDDAFRIIYCNDELCRMTGYSREEIIGQDFRKFLDDESRQVVADYYIRRQRGEKIPSRYEFNVIRKDGEKMRMEISSAVIKDSAGKIRTVAQILDITERKRAEEQYRTIISTALDGFWTVDMQGRFLDVNDAYCNLIGYNRKELLTMRIPDIEKVEKPEETAARIRKIMKVGGDRFETRHRCKDGRIVDIEVSVNYVKDAERMFVFLRDITERKRTDEALRQSESRYRELADSITDVFFAMDKDLRYTFWNKASEELTGIKAKDAIGKALAELFPDTPQTRRAQSVYLDVLRTQQPQSFVNEYKLGSKDLFFEISAYPSRDGISVFVRDTTERKQAEKALQESERKLRLLTENMRDVVFVYDMNRRLQYVNPAFEELTGYSIQELYEQNFINYLHPEDQERMMKLWDKVFQGKSFFNEEYRIVMKDGKTKWCSSSWGPLLDEKGRQIGIQGRELDITNRKLTAEALQKSEMRYRGLFECANDAVFLLDSKGKHLMVNKKAADMLGYSIDELISLSYKDIVAPSEYQNAQNKIKSILEDDSLSLHERIFRKKDGSEFPVEINVSLLRDMEGRALCIQRIVRDITERKRAENELKETSRKLRQALGSIISVVALTVEQRDPYTAGHQKRVSNLARAIAKEMTLSEDHIEAIYMAGMIHDIGKISVPAEILSKPSKLTEAEFALIKDHARIGYEILKEIEFPWPIAQIVYQHHERMNGSGYPQGLSGESLLLEARILNVADVVEAMASHRPYRPAHGLEKALMEISKNRSSLYDSGVVDACLKIFAENKFKFES